MISAADSGHQLNGWPKSEAPSTQSPRHGRVERREVGRGVVVAAHERAHRGVDDEGREDHERRQRREPPPVLAQGARLDRRGGWSRRGRSLPCVLRDRPARLVTPGIESVAMRRLWPVSHLSGRQRAHENLTLPRRVVRRGTAIPWRGGDPTQDPHPGEGRAGLPHDHRAQAGHGAERLRLPRIRARAHVRQPQGLRRPRRLQRVRRAPPRDRRADAPARGRCSGSCASA